MPRILIVDSYYPDFLKSWDFNPAATYETELRRLLNASFGTADFYSRNLRALGWEAQDVIANYPELQQLWAERYPGWYNGDRLEAQVYQFAPDVVFMQDLSIPITFTARLLAGQCSCPWPGDDKLRAYDVVFTSFPHYVERIERLGVKAVYNPLAFDDIVLDRCVPDDVMAAPTESRDMQYEKIHDAVFIGGVGNPSHWRRGMQTLEAVAEAIPTFKWWGYGFESLPSSSALRKCYQGEAWGLDMFRLLLQSKIAVVRHGEVAEGFANNMKLFESTGTGALLLTEAAPNLSDFFADDECVTYSSPREAVHKIQYYLTHEDARAEIAWKGQARCFRDHTYSSRMKCVSDVLIGALSESLHA